MFDANLRAVVLAILQASFHACTMREPNVLSRATDMGSDVDQASVDWGQLHATHAHSGATLAALNLVRLKTSRICQGFITQCPSLSTAAINIHSIALSRLDSVASPGLFCLLPGG